MDDEEGNKTWNTLDPPPAIDTIGARDRGRHTSRQQQQQPVFVVNIRLKRRGQQKPFNHLLQQQQVINGIASRRAKKKRAVCCSRSFSYISRHLIQYHRPSSYSSLPLSGQDLWRMIRTRIEGNCRATGPDGRAK